MFSTPKRLFVLTPLIMVRVHPSRVSYVVFEGTGDSRNEGWESTERRRWYPFHGKSFRCKVGSFFWYYNSGMSSNEYMTRPFLGTSLTSTSGSPLITCLTRTFLSIDVGHQNPSRGGELVWFILYTKPRSSWSKQENNLQVSYVLSWSEEEGLPL